jgi:26S proteasome regulatory subunit N2
MKADEASPRDGDVSPITQSVSNLPEENKPSTSKPKKTEPAFELRPNFSRVTPSQLAYISFPSDGRYQPVRAVSTKTPLSKAGKAVATSGPSSSALGLGSERYAGGGGILLLTDLRPNEEAEFIEIVTAPPAAPAVAEVVVPTGNGTAVGAPPPTGRHIALDENGAESEPPEAFEACLVFLLYGKLFADIISSTLSTTIHKP